MYSEKLAQFKQTVDQKTILAVLNANTENELRKLIQKYHIHIDVAEEAFSVLMLMCYGAISSSDCFNIINDMHVVSDQDFANFITDININILKTIQEKIKYTVVSTESIPRQQYENKLINPTNDEIKQSVIDAIDENVESAEEILARIEREANEEVDAEMRKRQEAQAQKEATLKKADELRLAEERRIEEEASKEFDAMPAIDILGDESDEESEGEISEVNKIQDVTNTKMAQTQNQITADLDLDILPKTPVSTYMHTNNNLVDAPQQVAPSNSMPEQPEAISTSANNSGASLSFIESKATGQIASTTDSKNTSPSQNLNNYMKDPYHEEL
jgi:hypothetical protein